MSVMQRLLPVLFLVFMAALPAVQAVEDGVFPIREESVLDADGQFPTEYLRTVQPRFLPALVAQQRRRRSPTRSSSLNLRSMARSHFCSLCPMYRVPGVVLSYWTELERLPASTTYSISTRMVIET